MTVASTTTIVFDRLLTVVGGASPADGDRISRAQFWCGGRWPAPLIAEVGAARR